VIPVTPITSLKGLYHKSGDTYIGFGDNFCRMLLPIKPKIFIDSLVADLVDYANPLCREWSRK